MVKYSTKKKGKIQQIGFTILQIHRLPYLPEYNTHPNFDHFFQRKQNNSQRRPFINTSFFSI